MQGHRTAHSGEPTRSSRWLVRYAVITMVPLLWILLTSIKSPPDSISYPPKVVFEPSIEGYCNLFTTRSRQTEDYIARACRRPTRHLRGRMRARTAWWWSAARTTCRASPTR